MTSRHRCGRRGFGAHAAGAALLLLTATGCAPSADDGNDSIEVVHQPLPAGWSGIDLGATPTPGSDAFVAATNTFMVTSSSEGVARQHYNFTVEDRMRFVYTSYTPPTSGDLEISFRLVSLSGSRTAEAGVMIRQTTADNSTAGAGYFRRNSVQSDAPDIPNMNEFGVSARTYWEPKPEGWEEDPGKLIYSSTRLDPGPDPDGAQDPPESFYQPIWFRLQRIGNDFTFARSANEIDWVPVERSSGGEYSPTGPVLVGFFVAAGLPGSGPTAATATIDDVYVGAPRVSARTSWIGSSYDQASTGVMSQSLGSFFVAPNGSRVYKYYPIVEDPGSLVRVLEGASGAIQRVDDDVALGNGVDQGALTGNGTSVYFARKHHVGWDPTGRYCIDRLNPDLTTLVPPVSFCPEVVTRVGGMAVGQELQGVAELFVSEVGPPPEPESPPPTTGTIRVFRGDTLVETNSFSVDPRPGPMAIDNSGNLWVIHAAVDYPIVGSYDVEFAPKVKRYTRTGTETGQLTGALLPENPVALAIDRRPGMDRMFVADNGSAQNVRVYRGLNGTPAADTTFNAAAAFGQPGGIYGGAASTRGLISSGGDNRFYALSGVGIDSAGSLYVALGAPYVDIRKYSASGTGNAIWSTYGLLNFANMIEFDDATNGQGSTLDVYTARHRFALDLDADEPGEEWSNGYRSVTWDAFPPAATPYREIDEHGLTRRRSGIPRIRTIDGQKFLFLFGQADDDPDGPTVGPRGAKGGILIYRFEGELAIPWGAIRHEQVCGYDNTSAEIECRSNPECDCNIDPDSDPLSMLDGFPVMTLWIDTNGDGVENDGEESTIDPLVSQPGCEAAGNCLVFETGFRNYEHPSDAMWENPPPAGPIMHFDVDSAGDVWISFGTNRMAEDPVTEEPVPLSHAIWQLKLASSDIPEGEGPVYGLALGTGRIQHPLPPEMDIVTHLRFEASTNAMYFLGRTNESTTQFVNRYDNWLSGSPVLGATVNLPYPALNVDVNAASNDFIHLRVPGSERPSCAGQGDCYWRTGSYFDWSAFDVAGDKIFVAERWGPIHVFEATTGLPVTTLIAGPEVSGFQSWNDVPMGLRAFKRADGEYLVAAGDSSGHARTLLFRWTPTVLPACTTDAQCAASEFCDAGECRSRPCNLTDAFASISSVFSPSVTADGFALSSDRLTAFVSRKAATNYDIYVAARASATGPFGELSAVGPLNSAADERAPWLSPDGLRIYFSRTNTSSGTPDLMMATRSNLMSPFQEPTAVPGVNHSTAVDQDPFLVPDEQTLFFTSSRVNGEWDIHAATRNGSSFLTPSAVAGINTSSEETRPMLMRDMKTIFFGSRRTAPSSDTDGDIWTAQRSTPTATFGTPTNVASLNTSGIDFPVALSADGCTLTFASNRETGSSGTQVFRLYEATRASSPSTVTVTLVIVGSGTVATSPFNCGPNTPGTCTTERPFGTKLGVLASRAAIWSGACEPDGAPGLSSDASLSFTLGGVCTVSFPPP